MLLSHMDHFWPGTQARPSPSSILIADDDVGCREVLRLFLEGYGFCCLEAKNGKTALEMIRTSSIGFLITDFHMPDMNGCELLEQVSNHNLARPPAMLITGDLTQQIKRRALEAGAITVLEKPFDQKSLLGMIHRHFHIPPYRHDMK